MAAVSPAFKEAIRVYLAERADNEPEFAVTLAKPQKNLDDCLTYILNKVKNSGQNAVLARKKVCASWYDKWYYDSPLEIRKHDTYHDYLRMSLHYVRTKFLSQLHMRGFDGNYYGLKPVKFMSLLLKCSPYETMLKQGDIYTMKLLMDRVGSKINRYWPSMKICRRHGYHISDYTIWTDHIDLLRHFISLMKSSIPQIRCIAV